MNKKVIQSGNFSFHETQLMSMILIETKVYEDDRGYFMETYHQQAFREGGINVSFVQDNHSFSPKGVLRGLHFQRNNPQGKLVSVSMGEVFDVAVDLRKKSKTYGKWEGTFLSQANRRMIYIPEGFAHGFLVLSDIAQFVYKCTTFYNPRDEEGIIYSDPDIGIEWPIDRIKSVIVSEKDRKLKSFELFNTAMK